MKKHKKGVFFITLLQICHGGYGHSDKRCIGYYKKLEDAVRVVEHDISLGDPYWDYAVIEEISSGAYCTSNRDSEIWYKMKYNSKTEKYKITKAKCPKQFENICNWGVG